MTTKMELSQQERLARIQLNAFTYLRADWFYKLIEVFGSAENILKQTPMALAESKIISLDSAKNLLKEAKTLNPDEEIAKTEKVNGKILLLEDEDYPESLKTLKEPPLVLYIRGNFNPQAIKVAVVGTRKITPYGKRCADKISADLSCAGIVVVSGLARGIDSTAQKAAVALNKPTYSVVGTGIGRCYPAENRKLATEILDNGGAIISELPFDKPPLPFHFPRRNRIIAGLSMFTAVIEGEEKSGALITAKLALEQGKDVFAVPGPIDSLQSGGTNMLIRDGATPLFSGQDIIDAIPMEFQKNIVVEDSKSKKEKSVNIANLSDIEKQTLELIASSELSLDDIVNKLNINVSEASTLLFNLEVKGILASKDGLYSKNKFFSY
ncbi:MAG: DNA-protecting protein DprA [Elusimicrobiaceae bacterium]|nr:DNA-protecting protein DprA [Elusimicrobiaceae bacterium]MBT4008432.1 DNA-protecting protein DprA [Elusimicrobiaceae bacterium]